MRYQPKSKKMRILMWCGLLAVLLLILLSNYRSFHSGVQIGCISHGGMRNWSANYQMIDGYFRKTLYPKTDTAILNAKITTLDGSISINIKDADGGILFSQDNIETSTFEVEVSSKVTIEIDATKHRGSYGFSFQ